MELSKPEIELTILALRNHVNEIIRLLDANGIAPAPPNTAKYLSQIGTLVGKFGVVLTGPEVADDDADLSI